MTVEGALDAQSRARAALIDRTTAVVGAAWDGLPGITDRDVAQFVNRVVPVILASQRTIGAATSSYIAAVVADMTGTAVRPVPPGDVTTMRGVDPPDVYRRPFVATYTALGTGTAVDAARAVGRDRLLRLVHSDLSNAHRVAVRAGMTGTDGVSGYRRVIRPELSRTGTCPLCRLASDRVYSRGDLLDIHVRCECDVLPIVRGHDPGASINDADTAGMTPVPADVDVVVREHGELGPMLQRAGVKFTGPAAVAA